MWMANVICIIKWMSPIPHPICVTTGRLTPVRSARYSERTPSKKYDRRVSRLPVECAPILLLGTGSIRLTSTQLF